MKDKRGFSLIEILVGLTVFSIVMAAMGSAFYKTYNDWQRQRDYNLVLENGRWAMELMSNEIRSGHGDANVTDAAEGVLNDHELLKFQVHPSSGSNNDNVYFWTGKSGFGQPFVLYRGQVGLSQGLSHANNNNVRRELSRFVASGTEIFNVSSDCAGASNCTVFLNLTVRPRPDQPEGPGNRNFTFRTLVRPRN